MTPGLDPATPPRRERRSHLLPFAVRRFLARLAGTSLPAPRPLADRRESETVTVTWPAEAAAGEPVHRFHIGVGLHADGRPGEVFCVSRREQSMIQQIIIDSCVFFSRLHQRHGLTFAEMEALMRADIDPVSPVGLVLRTVADEERRARGGGGQ